jgi:tetratricopeptide (TPR) repeat protein/MinD-like ATPase involved in chromosome partitioning or flagellar assembly
MSTQIVSFYSYKGGSGRSQLAANLAAYLCYYEDKKILLLDWDLEAPGIDYFFKFDRKKINKGIIEVFEEYVRLARSGDELKVEDLPFFDEPYTLSTGTNHGRIDLIPAANFNTEDYVSRINSFDWFNFYEGLDGRYYIEYLKEKLKEKDYDFVFIDSRTGHSDYLGICNIQLPDINIIVVAPSKQNIDGAYRVTNNILEHPYTKGNRPNPIVLPIFSRIDNHDGDKKNEWTGLFLGAFRKIINDTIRYTRSIIDGADNFVRDASINYDTDLAYGELIKFERTKHKLVPGSIEEKFIEIWKNVVKEPSTLDLMGNIEEASYRYFSDHREHKIPRALTPNPFLPDVFLGREDDLKAIHGKLFAPGGNLLLIVNGDGGVGKTSLAARYYHQYQHEYAHTAWVLSEKNIAGALLLLALPLGVQFEDAMNTEQRLERLLAAMAALDRPCLLVIDNANEPDDLQKHYLLLRRCSNFHLLLTSRITDFAQAERYRIEGLPLPEALKAFRTHYPKLQEEEENLVAQIHEAVGGNTLVLELLAKNLTQFNRLKTRYTLADLLADLQQRGLLAITYSQAVDTAYQSKGGALRHEKPEGIIATMYDLGDLSDEARALLSVFAVLPAERIGFETLEALLLNSINLDNQLLALAQSGWIEYNEKEAYFKCSPVVQQITKEKNKQRLLEDCRSLIQTLTEGLDSEVIHEDNYQRATQYARYAETLLLSLKQNDYDLAILCQNIGNFYTATGDLSKAMSAYQDMADRQSALLLESPDNVSFKAGLGWAFQFLGNTYTSFGNLERALDFLVKMEVVFKELYEAYPQNVSFKNGLAISYSKLGDTHSALGNLSKALTFFEKDIELSKALHEAYPQNVDFKNGLAISYEKLGEMHSEMGNLPKTLAFFEQFSVLMKELHEVYPQNVDFRNVLAISYSKLGETHSEMGNLPKALTFFEERSRLGKELHEAYPQNVSFKNGLAISYSKLGEMYAELGNLPKALTFFEERSRLGKELHEAYPQNVGFKNGLAISYSKLGEMHSEMGNLPKALTYFEIQTKLFEELYKTYPQNVGFKNGLAASYANLGVFIRNHLNDKGKARGYFQQAENLWVELVRDAPEYVQSQKFLGKVRAALADLEK